MRAAAGSTRARLTDRRARRSPTSRAPHRASLDLVLDGRVDLRRHGLLDLGFDLALERLLHPARLRGDFGGYFRRELGGHGDIDFRLDFADSSTSASIASATSTSTSFRSSASSSRVERVSRTPARVSAAAASTSDREPGLRRRDGGARVTHDVSASTRPQSAKSVALRCRSSRRARPQHEAGPAKGHRDH